MPSNDMKIIIEAVDKATAQLKGVKKSVDSVKDSTAEASKANKGFAESFKKSGVEINAKLELLKKGFLALSKVMQFIEKGAKFTQQKEAFNSLAKSVGADSKKLVQDLKEMSGQTLSTAETMQSATRAMALGLDANQLPQLMQISRAAARAFGQDVSFMFDSITLGIGRQSRMILDNLGIIVSSESAYQKYADSLGVAVKSLDENQRKQAFMNEAVSQGQDLVRKMNLSTKTQIETIQSVKAKWEDFTTAMAEFVANSRVAKWAIERVDVALKFYSQSLDKVSKQQRGGLLGQLDESLESTNRNIERLNSVLSKQVFFRAENEKKLNELLVQRERLLETIADVTQRSIAADGEVKLIEDKITLERMREKDLIEFHALKAQLDNEDRTRFESKLSSAMNLMQSFQQIQATSFKSIQDLAGKAITTFHSGFSNALTDVVTGTKKAKDAFADFGRQMVAVIVNWVAQKAVAVAISLALGKVMSVVVTKTAIQLAAAWAPAAALASLATLGGNAAPASAALLGTNAIAMGMALTPRAQGGDDIVRKPTLFLAGEAGPERATFSPLGGKNFHGASTVNIYIQEAKMDSSQSIAQTAEMLGFAIESRLRSAGGI